MKVLALAYAPGWQESQAVPGKDMQRLPLRSRRGNASGGALSADLTTNARRCLRVTSCNATATERNHPMNPRYKIALALLVGTGLGAAALQGLHAQAKPPTYVIVAVRSVKDADGFKAGVVDKASPAALAAASIPNNMWEGPNCSVSTAMTPKVLDRPPARIRAPFCNTDCSM